MRHLAKIISLLLLGVLASTPVANAAVFNYEGVLELCPSNVTPCIFGTIAVGDDFSGSIAIGDDVAQPDAVFSALQVSDWDFAFGGFVLNGSNSSIVMGELETDSAGDLARGFVHFFSPLIIADAPPVTVTLDVTTGTWFLLGWTPEPEWPFVVATGTGEFARVVPLPGALGLLVAGLAGLTVLGGRRRSELPLP